MEQRQGQILLRLARAAIAHHLGLGPEFEIDEPWLEEKRATFVTLKLDGELKGCIGSIEARRALKEDVERNSVAAAVLDPRFEPLRSEELARTRIEVSVLSAPEPFEICNEAEALRQLRPGTDGIVFECNGRKSTFLPQVWDDLPSPKDFMAHLKQKAGYPADFWSPDVRLHRYTCEKWREPSA